MGFQPRLLGVDIGLRLCFIRAATLRDVIERSPESAITRAIIVHLTELYGVAQLPGISHDTLGST